MNSTLRASFGLKVRTFREATGISQENFAYEHGIARIYMGNIKRGLANPSLDFIQTLSKALHVSISEFFTPTTNIASINQSDKDAVALRQEFGLRIKQLRESHSLSQDVFARKWQVDRSYVGRLEQGLTNPSLDAIGSLAEALEVSIAELFHGL